MSKLFSTAKVFFCLVGALFFSVTAFGQNSRLETDLKNLFGKFDLIRLDDQTARQRDAFHKTLQIPTAGRIFELNLTPRDLRAANYRAENTSGDETETLEKSAAVTTYKGTVGGETASQARLTIDGEKIEGYFSAGGEKFNVEPAKNYSPFADRKDLVVYREADLLKTESFVCESKLDKKIARGKEMFDVNRFQILPTYRVLEIATEADFAFVTELGGATNANNEILTILNLVEGNYETELGLTFDVVFQHAWSSADPFDATTSSTFLNSFRTYWNANYPQTSVPRDAAHLFTARASLSGRGLSYVGTICATPGSAYGFNGRLDVGLIKYTLTAHEIGHNFNATHVDAVPGCADTIMITSVSNLTPVDFCAFSRTEITNFVAASGGCLTTRNANSVNFDFDGDAKADIAVYRPSNGIWYITGSANNSFIFAQFGARGDIIVPADYDGDGKTDVAVFRAGTWFRLRSTTNTFDGVTFGDPTDIPAPADYDGDRKADITVFRPSSGVWHRLLSGNNNIYSPIQFGANGDVPLPADYDGDSIADVNVFRPSSGSWFRLNSSDRVFNAVQFGQAGDNPVVGDFDGDGRADVAVYRPSNGGWFTLRSSNNSLSATQFGLSTDIPTAADFDGDGKTDIAVFRPSAGTWFRFNSSTNAFVAVPFGAAEDVPVPAAYVR